MNAVDIKNVTFFYFTDKRRHFLHKIPLPIQRVTRERHYVLHDINWTIRDGKITALLGRNGSGKTSLIRLITGIRYPHSGSVHIFGKTPDKAKSNIGLCLGGGLVYHRLTARENLEYFGKLYGVEKLQHRVDELADFFGLKTVMDDMVETFSFGMKAKLALARSLIHRPKLLVLDEPTLGIDVQLAEDIRGLIRSLKCSVLLTTHYMEEADQLADDICVIDKGRIIEWGTKKEVLSKHGVKTVPDAFRSILEDPVEVKKAS